MKQIKIFNLSERKKVKLILLILGSKKKLHSSRVINLIERGELSPFLLWSKSRNESLPFFFFFSFLPFSCNLCWRVVRQWLAFFKFDVYSYPQCPANSHISPLTGSLRFFHISTFSPDPGVFSRCALYFTNPRFLFVSYPTGAAPLSYIPVTDPSPVFLLQLYSTFPFEIFVEIFLLSRSSSSSPASLDSVRRSAILVWIVSSNTHNIGCYNIDVCSLRWWINISEEKVLKGKKERKKESSD